MFPPPDDQSPTINQPTPAAVDMEWSASQSLTIPEGPTASTTYLPKRRHDDIFPDDDMEDEEISPSKKPRPSESEILPRIHHLRCPRNEVRTKRHPVSDRDRKRKKAGERALLQSYRENGLLQANTLSNTGVKKVRPLSMALGPSHYDDPSDYLLALPIAQTPNLWDVSEVEEPEKYPAIKYAFLENGQYSFDLVSVAYDLLDEVFDEEAAHMRWLQEVNRSIASDINEYVHLHPKYRHMSDHQKTQEILNLIYAKENDFTSQWYKTSKDIPFDAVDDETMEAQVVMSIAGAAHLNPLPSNITQDDIAEFVEKVQRIGIEYHRAYNREFLYRWQKKVKKARRLERERTERAEEFEREWQAQLHPPPPPPPPSPLQREQEDGDEQHVDWRAVSSSPLELGNETGGLPGGSDFEFGSSPPWGPWVIDPRLFE